MLAAPVVAAAARLVQLAALRTADMLGALGLLPLGL